MLTVYTVYLGMEKHNKKICPECQCEIRKSYRICPECGHLFQEGLSEEQLTDVIEKEKEDDMSSEQIDRAFEKVDTLSMEEVKAYDSELDDFLRNSIFGVWLGCGRNQECVKLHKINYTKIVKIL